MVQIITIVVNEPGGHNIGITFQTSEDFVSFIAKFTKEAKERGYELLLRRAKDGTDALKPPAEDLLLEKH